MVQLNPDLPRSLGGKETAAVNRGFRKIGVLFAYIMYIKPHLGTRNGRGESGFYCISIIVQSPNQVSEFVESKGHGPVLASVELLNVLQVVHEDFHPFNFLLRLINLQIVYLLRQKWSGF